MRKKYVTLTPEEYVRQHCIHQLEKNGFSPNKMSVEQVLAGSKKRYDLICFNDEFVPTLLVECKAPTVNITEKTLNQITSYLTLQNADNLLITNGLEHYWIARKNNKVEIKQEIPDYSEISR